MAFVQQEYNVGEEFNTYNLTNLTADQQAGSDWVWEHRTLSCFRKEDGTFISLGDAVTYNDVTAQVSGIWTLDKSDHALSIFGLGQTGRVNVKITENNYDPPLADNTHIYVRTQDYYLDHGTRTIVVDDIYCQTGVNSGGLSINISCEDGTRVKSIKCGNVSQDSGFNSSNELITWGWDQTLTFHFPDNSVTVNNHDVWENGLSIDFTQSGVLTYIPNKTYVNQ